MHRVPPVVRNKAVVVGADEWLRGLDTLISDVEHDWSIAVGPAYPDATEAFVAEATLPDGAPAVLKLIMPRDSDAARAEVAVLRLANGDGCVRLLRDDLDRPCSERAVDDALACAARRIAAHDDERAVLVHGDVHEWNALEAGSGFKLVDPDGLLAEAEYDMGILMREDPRELVDGDPRERAHALAARTGLDATAIWEWGVVERVSTGLLGTAIDLQPVAREMLEVADRIALSIRSFHAK